MIESDRSFYVVLCVVAGLPGFRFQGVFSKKEEADALKEELDSLSYCRGPIVLQMRISQIVDDLVEQRLGEMAKVLEPLLQDVRKVAKPAL